MLAGPDVANSRNKRRWLRSDGATHLARKQVPRLALRAHCDVGRGQQGESIGACRPASRPRTPHADFPGDDDRPLACENWAGVVPYGRCLRPERQKAIKKAEALWLAAVPTAL